MNQYQYTDHKCDTVIFECVADSLLGADKLYQTSMNVDPAKQFFVGVSIVFGEKVI